MNLSPQPVAQETCQHPGEIKRQRRWLTCRTWAVPRRDGKRNLVSIRGSRRYGFESGHGQGIWRFSNGHSLCTLGENDRSTGVARKLTQQCTSPLHLRHAHFLCAGMSSVTCPTWLVYPQQSSFLQQWPCPPLSKRNLLYEATVKQQSG